MAQQRRHEQWQHADIIVWCSDLSADTNSRMLDERLFSEVCCDKRPVVRIGTKADLADEHGTSSTEAIMPVSAKEGGGLGELCEQLAEMLATEARGQRQWLGMTAARCQESLRATRDALNRTAEAVSQHLSDDLIAVELRDTLDHIAHIVGAVYTDDILDRIFSRFCIGK